MKYRLKKDTPWDKAGKIFTKNGELLVLDNEDAPAYPIADMPHFKDFFEEVQEPKWTDADMKVFAGWFYDSGPLGKNMDGYFEAWVKQLRSEQTVQECDATDSK